MLMLIMASLALGAVGAEADRYWSSTSNSVVPENGWFVRFDDGSVFFASTGGGFHMQAVRGGL